MQKHIPVPDPEGSVNRQTGRMSLCPHYNFLHQGKDRQYTYNVTLKRVRVTIVTVEK
jgi:hypothetical protein